MGINKIKYETIVNILLFISLVTVLFNDLLFGKLPAVFYYNENIHYFLSNISIAYMSSWIFYFLVVVLKERKDKKNVYESALRITGEILNSYYLGVYRYLIESSGKEIFEKYYCEKINYMCITIEQIKTVIEKSEFDSEIDYSDLTGANNQQSKAALINFFHADLGVSLPITYRKLIYFYGVTHFEEHYYKIMMFVPHLETEYVRILNQIKDASFIERHFRRTELYPGNHVEFYTKSFYSLFQTVSELKKYYDDANIRILKRKKEIQKPPIP